MPGQYQANDPPPLQYDEPGNILAPPAGTSKIPFPPGTAQTIMQWINRLSDVMADLHKGATAGLNVSALQMRAQAAFSTLQKIYQVYYGQIPPNNG